MEWPVFDKNNFSDNSSIVNDLNLLKTFSKKSSKSKIYVQTKETNNTQKITNEKTSLLLRYYIKNQEQNQLEQSEKKKELKRNFKEMSTPEQQNKQPKRIKETPTNTIPSGLQLALNTKK